MNHFEKRMRAQSAAAVVGIDAGKVRHAIAVRPRGAPDSKPILFDATRAGFETALETIRAHAPEAQPSETLVGIEFAGNYGFTLAHFLAERGYGVVSVLGSHSKRWKDVRHNQSLKSDPADALTITDLAAQGNFVSFPFLDPVYADLRYLVSHRERLSKLRTGVIARLRDVLQVVWPEFERRFPNFNKKTPIELLKAYPTPEAFLAARKTRVVRLLRDVSRGHLGEGCYAELRHGAQGTIALPGAAGVLTHEIGLQLELFAAYDDQIAKVESLMAESVRSVPEGRALLTIPKLGAVTAAVFLGSLGDPQAYESSRQVLRVGGLSLTVHESGKQRGKPRLSKHGRPELRRSMYMFAVRSVANEGIYAADYARLLENNGGRKLPALVALMRKATKLMYSVAKDRRDYTMEPPRV